MFNFLVLFFLVLEVLRNCFTAWGSYGTVTAVCLTYPILTTASVACGRLTFCSMKRIPPFPNMGKRSGLYCLGQACLSDVSLAF